MKVFNSSAAEMRLIGGRLCLDFVNTVDGRKNDSARRKSQSVNSLVLGDKLGDYSDLVAWSQHSGIGTATEAGRLIQESKRKAAEARAVFDRAIELREALHRIFKATVTGRMPLTPSPKRVTAVAIAPLSNHGVLAFSPERATRARPPPSRFRALVRP